MAHRLELRPLSLGEVLDAAFTMYRRLFLPLVFIAIVTQSVPLLMSTYVELTGGVIANSSLWLVSLVAALLASSIGLAASTFMIAETYLGGSITAQEALRRAVPFMGRIIGASVLSTLLLFVGAIFLIVPGIVFFCGLAVSSPALVIENLPSATAGLSRSWFLTKGFKGKVFVAYFVAFMLLAIPAFALGATSLVAARGSTADTISFALLVVLLLQALLQLLAYPFFYILTTLLYYDFRVRKEAYDLEMLATSLTT